MRLDLPNLPTLRKDREELPICQGAASGDSRILQLDLDGSFLELTGDALLAASSKHQHPPNPEDAVCEFYNVLWIKRREGIAHRRACGWVPEYIWEAHVTGPVEVKLG